MQIYTVSFFGHRRIENSRHLETQLEDIICRFLRENEFTEFLVGRDGDFDLLVSSVIRRIKKEHSFKKLRPCVGYALYEERILE